MKPCPRCAAPFVEAAEVADHTAVNHIATQFRCYVCLLHFTVPLAQAAAIVVWDDWKRASPEDATAALAAIQRESMQRGPDRLERLVCAMLHSERISFPMGDSVMDHAAKLVNFAIRLEDSLKVAADEPVVAR